MNPLNLYFGKVESVEDPDQKSRMQIRILPEMERATTDHLPWLEPFMAGSTMGTALKHHPLEVGSTVWCFFTDQSLRTGWYVDGFFVNEKFDFSSVGSDLGNITDASAGDYKDLRLSRYEDGTIHFVNVSTSVSGTYHPSGSYVIFDENGGIVGYSKDKITFYNDTNSIELGSGAGITIDSGANSIIFNGQGNNLVKYNELKLILDFLMANLDSRMYIDPLSGVTGVVNPTHISATFDPQYPSKLSGMKTNDLETSS